MLLANCWCGHCLTAEVPDLAGAGKPPRNYEVPKGWSEFGIHSREGDQRTSFIYKNWHIAYHSCKGGADTIKSIIRRGCALLKAGDTTFDGDLLKVQPGHLTAASIRKNWYSRKQELFDPTDKFFMSPSWRCTQECTCSSAG